MKIDIVPLTPEFLDDIATVPLSIQQAYFSPGSLAYCMLADDVPVIAGGIVNMMWHRGEAWLLPTSWFNKHLRVSLEHFTNFLPCMAKIGGFRRVQATCNISSSVKLFRYLGFYHEGTMNCFDQDGNTCFMYARIFSK